MTDETTNPYALILRDPNLTATGADRDIRVYCTGKFGSLDPSNPNPYTAVLAAGVPSSISSHRRMVKRMEQLAEIWQSQVDERAARAEHARIVAEQLKAIEEEKAAAAERTNQ